MLRYCIPKETAAVLHPCMNIGCAVELSLMLDAKAPLCVERAVMDVAELW